MENRGIVYLIGSGPGDPGLITLKGKECLERADVIIYDYLINEDLLKLAKKNCEFIYVGKKGGAHTLPQEEINALLVRKAKEGKRVVRLKGGDPFIFGRGGEEAERLAEEGIPFEVVPGVTSAISVPAYAGIPLTHRNYTSTVAFITGHEDPSKDGSNIQWDKISTGAGTLVFLMGIKNLSENVKRLIDNGRDENTPVALIRWGTTPNQETLVGKLKDIDTIARRKNFKPPAVMVVGDVVRLRDKLNWFEKKPLFGKRILVTRAREQASELAARIREFGGDIIEFPTIEIVPIDRWEELDVAIKNINKYEWIIFTSINGVRIFLERLRALSYDIRELKGVKICTIGIKTGAFLENLMIKVDMIPSEYKTESIIEEFKKEDIKGKRILIPRAKEGRELLPEKLKELGAIVDEIPVYRIVKPEGEKEKIKELFKRKEIDVITFTSSSTVKNFVSMFNDKEEILELIDGVKIASIGPVTAETLKSSGIKTDIMPEKYTIPDLVEAIINYYGE